MTPPCYLCARIHRLALQNSINSDNDDVATPTKRAVCAGCTPSGFATFPGARRAVLLRLDQLSFAFGVGVALVCR